MRALLTAAAVVALSGCAMLESAVRGDVRGMARGADALAQDAARRAATLERQRRECQVLGTRAVAWEEELGIGGAVAVGLVSKTRGVFIEPSPDVPAKLTPQTMPKQAVAPGTGPKTDLHRMVAQVGKALALGSKRPFIPWTFVVVEAEAKNAFSAPGGYVMVTTGLLKALENESQLALVLAHEIGHVTDKHALTSYQKSRVTQCEVTMGATVVADVAESALPPGVRAMKRMLGSAGFDVNQASAELIRKLTDGAIEGILDAGLGQAQEYDADRTAIELAYFAGYDPREFPRLLQRLPDGTYFSPHPSHASRIERMERAFAELGVPKDLKSPELKAKLTALP